MTDFKRFLPIIIVFCFMVDFGTAQPTIKYELLSTSQLKKSAKAAARKKDFFTAINYYEAAVNRKPNDAKLNFELAEMQRATRNYRKAQYYYQKSYDIDNEKYMISLYFVARMQMTQELYFEAIENFEYFRKKYDNKKEGFDFRRSAKNLIEGCELALLDSSEKKVRVHALKNNINQAYNESAPTPISSDKLLFSSIRSDTIIHYEDSLFQDSSRYRNLIYLALKDGEDWTYDKKFSGPFEYNDYDVGNPCFSLDSTRLYFTKCQKNWKYEIICNIYYVDNNDGVWGEVNRLSEAINSKKHSSSQPCIGVNPKNGNEILYFVSNNKSGKGGFDLWYSERKRGEFSEARNLGGRMNTEGDEMSPYFDKESSTLYFSSNGHPTYGELDIFKSFGNKSKWMKNPENLGKPINSPADDLYFIHGSKPEVGFFTSNRDGSIALKNPNCCDDIYTFKMGEILRVKYISQIVSSEEQSIISGDVQVFLRDPVSGDTTYLKSTTIDETGKLSINIEKSLQYLLIIESPNHFIRSVEIPKKTYDPEKSETDTIVLTTLSEKSFILKNIYYDFDDFRLSKKAEAAIDSSLLKMLMLNPEIKIEISSHTDDKGSSMYNLKLSQKRAESVVLYLKKNGIPSSRMIAKGYGKTKPIASNKNEDGSDNPEGRQLNRRTEFKIIGFNKKGKYKKIPTSKYAK